jgi:MYXO-CTERM domain-containing protein
MKKVTTTLSILAICALMGISNPIFAQSSTGDNTNTTTATHTDNDSGKWGLAGLLGLLGLLGLRKKDDVRHTTTTNRAI